jgi:hypothetical protein
MASQGTIHENENKAATNKLASKISTLLYIILLVERGTNRACHAVRTKVNVSTADVLVGASHTITPL